MEDASCFGLGLWESSFGEGSCEGGPFVRLAPAHGFYISEESRRCLGKQILFLGLLDNKCKSFGIKFGEGRRQRLRKSLHK